ncbi:hypothetical protein TNCV_4867361 [Trichonephila clavipes]|nr:hypothetical protein TNCV_4867361 [Trichonephila clavipes]
MVTERLARQHTPVTTVDELWHRVEAAWTSVSVHVIQSLFDSMPRRIRAVITARGGCSGPYSSCLVSGAVILQKRVNGYDL